jgi:hypothetical protein
MEYRFMNTNKVNLTLVEFFERVDSHTIGNLIIALFQDEKVSEGGTVKDTALLLAALRAAETALSKEYKVRS